MGADFGLTECATAEWPVPECTQAAFEHAALTHNVVPLPAFDEDHSLIAPTDYQKKLCGTVVNVHFRLVHYFIQQEKKSVFTAIVHEIFVLRKPPVPPVNPLKCGHLADGPSFSPSVSAKRFRVVSPTQNLLIDNLTTTVCSNCWQKTMYSCESKRIGTRKGEKCKIGGGKGWGAPKYSGHFICGAHRILR